MGNQNDFGSDDESENLEEETIKVEGVKGRFLEVKSINDKYGARPKGIERITLSQFATSYSKCIKKPMNVSFNEDGCTEECGNIIDHLRGERLPKYIELTDSKEVYRLRAFPTVLKIHASSKKSGEEEYFAEMQLFSPWRPYDLEQWELPQYCIEEFNRRRHEISEVRKKTFPYAMNVLIEEVKAQEGLNHISENIAEILDAQGVQDDMEANEEGSQEISRPVVDFDDWVDDLHNAFDQNSKHNEGKFRPLEMQSKDQLLASTKALVPEQSVVLQKVLDFAKTTVQCRNSGLA